MLNSVILNWAGLVIAVVSSLLIAPVMIRGLGDLHFGMWALVGSLLDYAGLLDMGLRTSFVRFVAQLHAKQDRPGLNVLVSTGIVAALCSAGLIFVAVLILTPLLPVFLRLEPARAHEFRLLFLMLGTSIAVAFPTKLFGAYFCGVQRFDLFNGAESAQMVLRAVLLYEAITHGYGIGAVGAITLLMAIAAFTLQAFLLRRADPQLHFSYRLASRACFRELANFSVHTFTNMGGEYLRSPSTSRLP